MQHYERRWFLHSAVEHLEPAAHSASVRDYIWQYHEVDLPLLRIYVDLESLVASGFLLRQRKCHPSGTGTTFFWETTNKVMAEPDRPDPQALTAAVSLRYRSPEQTDAVTAPRTAAPVTTRVHETAGSP